MTRINTRSSRRLVSSASIEDSAKDSPRLRTRNRTVQPILFSSSDSEDENVFKKPPRTPRKTKIQDRSCERPPVTPPKQKKIESKHFTTPENKYCDNNENVCRNPQTPSTLLRNLSLLSPLKNRSITSENDKCDKKLEYESVKTKCDVYQNARRALHSTLPTDMPGREKELGELRDFIMNHIEEQTSGTLYVSGPPGTGKTASLNIILQQDDVAAEVKQIYINCTAIKSSGYVYSRIAKELGLKSTGKTEKDYLKTVESYLTKNHKMILLVLDEIDQLESKKQSVLYTIFEWPAKPNSRLILIGIANALDLTDRTLPRLQARCELKPKLMHFAPYTKQQIVQIFTARLKEAGVLEVFSPVALQMLAGKVASVSGDVRRALDIGRRVVELVDRSRKSEVLKSIENLASELVENENNENIVKAVDMKQVVSVLNNVYGTTQNLDDDAEETFPLQQKIIICSLLLILNKAKNKDVTIGKLHEVYRKACAKRNLLAVDQAEFVGLCNLIETKGIIRVTKKKEPRMSKVNLEWNEEEVSNALKDKQLMSLILQDTSCLGKM